MVESTRTETTLRRRIIEAADSLIREQGLAGATTRQIARAAGCAEGSIYVHFQDKIDLVIAVIVERDPYFADLLALPSRAGEGSVETNLEPWVDELVSLMRENQPIFFALMGDRNVFQRFKTRIRERQTGLVAVFKAASDYVRAEQELGRIDRRVDAGIVATILIWAARDHTFTSALTDNVVEPAEGFARELVRTVARGLNPIPSNIEEEAS
jgi:AcrR family transcriptional regulator